jgi:hypothetical protein
MDFPYECDCFNQNNLLPTGQPQRRETWFHAEQQDTECEGWKRLLGLIEQAAADGREEFAPGHDMTEEQWSQVITLPSTIANLKSVKRLLLWGSVLLRLPPEVGEMDSLERFEPYTSHRLHWFPYEITRCKRLTRSLVSTRSLYGNVKNRAPFPKLELQEDSTVGLDLRNLQPSASGTTSIKTCSVCDAPLAGAGLYQVWLSLNVATDVLPLLVSACSRGCISRLPQAPDDYVNAPHIGGPDVRQPPCR